MKSLGVVVGFTLTIVLVTILIIVVSKKLNNDNSSRTKYDERQQIVSGQGYKYRFWTVVGLIVAFIVLDVAEIDIPIKTSVMYFLAIVVGVLCHTTYCIFNDGYFGINNNPKQYYVMFVLIGLFNVLIGVMNCIRGNLISDGKLDVPAINLFCGLMFVVLGICIVIKSVMDKKKNMDDDEEDDE